MKSVACHPSQECAYARKSGIIPLVKADPFTVFRVAVLMMVSLLTGVMDSPGSRVAWTQSRIQGTPEPEPSFLLKRVFPDLRFRNPIALTSAPESDRLFLAELDGKVYSFTSDTSQFGLEPDLFFDLRHSTALRSAQIYGLTFHPDYPKNGFVYLCYIVRNGLPEGTRVSRFKVTTDQPPVLDPESESVIITWPSGGHNGGCIKFGPEGALYISTGDAAGPNPPDPLNTGQDNSDLLSSILRIDVNHHQPGVPYLVPDDNPFKDRDGFRPEIWAYGFRNPWKMSFDRKGGDLWVGDVGWELWELIHRVDRGGNYGWSVFEGRHPVRRDLTPGPDPIRRPLVDHSHSEAASITGGFVYRGNRLPELAGAYIYGDYETGKIWGLRQSNGQVTWNEELLDASIRIICFGEDRSGELYLVGYNDGGLYQLERNPASGRSSRFPQRLSETGLFDSVTRHEASTGVIPYRIHSPLWSDGALAERWIAVPGKATLETAGRGEWTFPDQTVFLKTLSLPRSGRRVETQLLHLEKGNWNAYSYLWNEAQDDAELVPEEGRQIVIQDTGESLRWNVSSRSECLRCHNSWRKGILAFRPEQLISQTPLSDSNASEYQRLVQQGLFIDKAHLRRVKPLVNPHDETADLNDRARSYLHANCAHCHSRNAGGSVPSLMTYQLNPGKMHLIGEEPLQGRFGIRGAEIIAEGDPCRSVLYYRMAKTGRGRMPHLGSSKVDLNGVELIYQWIRSMGSSTADDSPDFDPDSPMVLSNTSQALRVLRALDRGTVDPSIVDDLVQMGSQHPSLAVRELFDRYLPEEKRAVLLGSQIHPSEILAYEGNPERGRDLFFASDGMQCQACHQIKGKGRAIGPELSRIGSTSTREQILSSIINPSETISETFTTHVIETVGDVVLTGFIVEQTETELRLRDTVQQDMTLPMESIQTITPDPVSLMPEQLLRDVTAQDAADLIAFLVSLKE